MNTPLNTPLNTKESYKDYTCPKCGMKYRLIGRRFINNPECSILTCPAYNDITVNYTKEQYKQLADIRKLLTGADTLTGEAIIVDVTSIHTAVMYWKPYGCLTPIYIPDDFRKYLHKNNHSHYYQLTPSSFEQVQIDS